MVRLKGSDPSSPRRRLPVLICYPGWLRASEGLSTRIKQVRPGLLRSRHEPKEVTTVAPSGAPAGTVLSSVSCPAGRRKCLVGGLQKPGGDLRIE